MKRPKLEEFHQDFKYHSALEQYCTLLEETIAALKDEHAEMMQNYTDCVNTNKELTARLKECFSMLDDSSFHNYGIEPTNRTPECAIDPELKGLD